MARLFSKPRTGRIAAFRKVTTSPHNPLLRVALNLKDRSIRAIVDNGAQFSCIRSDVIEYLHLTGETCSFSTCHLDCLLADRTKGMVSNAVKLHLGLLSFTWTHEYKILDGGPFRVILGLDFLERTQMTLNLPAKTFEFVFAPERVFSFVVENPVSEYEPFLQELWVKVAELSSVAHVRPKQLCEELLREKYPRLFS